MEPTALYRHFDAVGRLLYVGISSNTLLRTDEHGRQAKWFHEVSNIKIESFPTRKAAIEVEKRVIKEERPKYNILHNSGDINRMKTGYSLDWKLIKRAKHLATEEEVDVNDLIEEGLRLVFEKRVIPA